MDPFEQENESNQILSNPIIVWTETSGKRINTYITGLPFDDDKMKEHLTNLKKKHGCNGSYKEKVVDDVHMMALQLQGDHIVDIIEYFKKYDINNIKIR
jgi:translation initiation factor 1 (eIF-1/SUI1)